MSLRKRLSRADWLDLGLAQLSAHGPEALKVETLCVAAGVTKGSFYHHFADLPAFLLAVADAWTARQTTDLIADFDPSGVTETLMQEVVEVILSIDLMLEIRIRELGRRVPEIAERVAATDQIRLEFTTMLYEQIFGVPRALAQDLAMLDYAAFTGVMVLDPHITIDRRRHLAGMFDRIARAAIQSGALT